MKRVFALLASALMLAAVFPTSVGAIVAGAGFTTTNIPPDPAGSCFNGPGVVNCNIYDAKAHVWINGGPTNGVSALSDGTYFFVVGVPGGQNIDINDSITVPDNGTDTPKNLSDDFDAYTNRTFTVVNHHITGTTGTHEFTNGKIRLFPYSDTTNQGGEYFVAICRIDQAGYPADPSACKYDNFKVKEGNVVDFGVLSGLKYYDANVNGKLDAGEVGIPGWPIDFTDGVANTVFTGASGEFTLNLAPDIYTFMEVPASSPWMQTGNTFDQTSSGGGNSAALNADKSYTVTVVANGQTTGLNFGNVCVGAGGGRTLGFWSNKNGQAQMNDGGTLAPELAMLNALHLANATGNQNDFSTYAQFRTWILNANATSMAYMLSAQLAAMTLNIEVGFVNPVALVWNGSAFVSIGSVVAAAEAALTADQYTPAGDEPNRSTQAALKNALDKANNNLNFLQPGPSSCPTPIFP